jgi:hypothetical protein
MWVGVSSAVRTDDILDDWVIVSGWILSLTHKMFVPVSNMATGGVGRGDTNADKSSFEEARVDNSVGKNAIDDDSNVDMIGDDTSVDSVGNNATVDSTGCLFLLKVELLSETFLEFLIVSLERTLESLLILAFS